METDVLAWHLPTRYAGRGTNPLFTTWTGAEPLDQVPSTIRGQYAMGRVQGRREQNLWQDIHHTITDTSSL